MLSRSILSVGPGRELSLRQQSKT